MPAILTENGFMDNIQDAEYLASEDGRGDISLAHFMAILQMEGR